MYIHVTDEKKVGRRYVCLPKSGVCLEIYQFGIQFCIFIRAYLNEEDLNEYKG